MESFDKIVKTGILTEYMAITLPNEIGLHLTLEQRTILMKVRMEVLICNTGYIFPIRLN